MLQKLFFFILIFFTGNSFGQTGTIIIKKKNAHLSFELLESLLGKNIDSAISVFNDLNFKNDSVKNVMKLECEANNKFQSGGWRCLCISNDSFDLKITLNKYG